MSDFAIPQSRVAREAHELARTSVSEAILAHSVRAFHLGREMGRRMHLSVDDEALYIATVLHDLGFADAAASSKSFEVVGADTARAFLTERDDGRAGLVWDAIAMHTVPHLAREGAPEVLLTHLGSAADAFGVLLERVAPDFVAELTLRYPRGAIRAELRALMAHHATTHPFGQLAALRALGLQPLE